MENFFKKSVELPLPESSEHKGILDRAKNGEEFKVEGYVLLKALKESDIEDRRRIDIPNFNKSDDDIIVLKNENGEEEFKQIVAAGIYSSSDISRIIGYGYSEGLRSGESRRQSEMYSKPASYTYIRTNNESPVVEKKVEKTTQKDLSPEELKDKLSMGFRNRNRKQ